MYFVNPWIYFLFVLAITPLFRAIVICYLGLAYLNFLAARRVFPVAAV
jgi:hypothetical protein